MAPVFYMNVKADQTGGSWNHSFTFLILHMLTIIHLIIAVMVTGNTNEFFKFFLTDDCVVTVTGQMWKNAQEIYNTLMKSSMFIKMFGNTIYVLCDNEGFLLTFH